MMFNNIIYFIIAITVYSTGPADRIESLGLVASAGIAAAAWLAFAVYCMGMFKAIQKRLGKGDQISLSNDYHNILLRLSVVALFLFSFDFYFLNLRYWFILIPGANIMTVIPGMLAISLFVFYLSTVWFFAHPLYQRLFDVRLSRGAFIASSIKINLPVIFPWVLLTLALDLVVFTPWPAFRVFIEQPGGQLVYIAFFICVLMIFLPVMIKRWWGCRPMAPSAKLDAMEHFLEHINVRYRALLNWPIFEGRMITAGIMGVVPRFRYILVTDSLMDMLNTEDLKAVMAHEAGHAKYHHIILYMIFTFCFMFLSYGMYGLFFQFIAFKPHLLKMIGNGDILSIPVLVTTFIYFRFVLGFFMRNFERQADLYSAQVMADHMPAVNALEKVAIFSGKSRELPSWHHFSIKERVECLQKAGRDPGVIARHNRFVGIIVVSYLLIVLGLGFYLNFETSPQRMEERMNAQVEQMLKENPEAMIAIYEMNLEVDPENLFLLQGLASLYLEMEREKDAAKVYERINHIYPDEPLVLNNLAWVLVTSSDPDMLDYARGLELAKRAVMLDPDPGYLDTLAEAYYVNGMVDKAIETIRRSIAMDPENNYYWEQLKRFEKGDEYLQSRLP
jgi:Zn-dependent protease with chaperone function